MKLKWQVLGRQRPSAFSGGAIPKTKKLCFNNTWLLLANFYSYFLNAALHVHDLKICKDPLLNIRTWKEPSMNIVTETYVKMKNLIPSIYTT